MKIFDEKKENEIETYDKESFKLEPFKRFVARHEAVEAMAEQYHIEVTRVYQNGSKETRRVIDSPKVEAKEAYDEYEDCLYIVPLTIEERKDRLRGKRQAECFSVLDRSQFWYDNLTEAEKTELKEWYTAWLHVTDTMEIPNKPEWLEERL